MNRDFEHETYLYSSLSTHILNFFSNKSKKATDVDGSENTRAMTCTGVKRLNFDDDDYLSRFCTFTGGIGSRLRKYELEND